MTSLLQTSPTARSRSNLVCRVAALALAAGLSFGAHAEVGGGIGSYPTDNPEFLLIISDASTQTTYALDLGIDVQTLRTTGQSDAGFQQFWTLDPAADNLLAAYLAASGSVSAMRWQVVAVDKANDLFEQFGDFLYTTLEHTTPTGTVSPNYTSFAAFSRGKLETALNGQGTYIDNINGLNCGGNNGMCTGSGGDPANNGSLFAPNPDAVGSVFSPSAAVLQLGLPGEPLASNLVGRSSWAYMATLDFYGADLDPMVLDEFDNLEHDAYWGLAQDPDSGILYLSYTLDAVGMTATQREFALGIGRTEVDAGFSVRRLAGVAVVAGMESPTGISRALGSADFVGAAVPMAPVPEPATWGLMALGLAGLAARARRRG